jgi:hypothetical protein
LYRWTAQDKKNKNSTASEEKAEKDKSSATSRKDCNRVDMAASVMQGSATEEVNSLTFNLNFVPFSS